MVRRLGRGGLTNKRAERVAEDDNRSGDSLKLAALLETNDVADDDHAKRDDGSSALQSQTKGGVSDRGTGLSARVYRRTIPATACRQMSCIIVRESAAPRLPTMKIERANIRVYCSDDRTSVSLR